MNLSAQKLGRLARGKRKTYSPAEIEKRTERLRKINEARKLLKNKAI